MKITTPCDNYFVLWKQKKVLSYYYTVNFSHNLETKIQSWMINQPSRYYYSNLHSLKWHWWNGNAEIWLKWDFLRDFSKDCIVDECLFNGQENEIETYNWLMLPVTVNFSIGFMAAATVNTAGQAKKGRSCCCSCWPVGQLQANLRYPWGLEV